MKVIIKLFVLLVFSVLFTQCVLDNSEKTEDTAEQQDTTGATDTSNTAVNTPDDSSDTDGASSLPISSGQRLPRSPETDYIAVGSKVAITVQTKQKDDELNIWIFRNDSLLLPPLYEGGSTSSNYFYQLIDSLDENGTYTYKVHYGFHRDSLSQPPDSFVYVYEKQDSLLGHLNAELSQTTSMGRLYLTLSPDVLVKLLVIERKNGINGEARDIDSILISSISGDNQIAYTDTSLLSENAMIYYRVKGLDAISEAWLKPTPWDSVEIENKYWKYIPQLLEREVGLKVELYVTNTSSSYNDVMYYLYRGTTSAADAGTLIDSLDRKTSNTTVFIDTPSDSGLYYYWCIAKRDNGLTSTRSVPLKVQYTGKPEGVGINGISVNNYSSGIRVSGSIDNDFFLSQILFERKVGDAGEVTPFDTVTLTSNNSSVSSSYDTNTYKGVTVYYRATGMDAVSEKWLAPTEWENITFDDEGIDDVWEYLPQLSLNDQGTEIIISILDRTSSATYFLYRNTQYAPEGAVLIDSSNGYTSQYTDIPSEAGTYYYWVIAKSSSDKISPRSIPKEIEFRAKPWGPLVESISNNYSSMSVRISNYTNAIAFILERAKDTANFTLVDTISTNSNYSYTSYSDIPPDTGYWQYRVKAILNDMSVSEYGKWKKSTSKWTNEVTYDTYSYTIYNRGTYVQTGSLSRSSGYAYYLYRSPKSDRKDSVLIQKITYNDSKTTMVDTPVVGTYYYWVERTVEGSMVIRRSNPTRIEFTNSDPKTIIQTITSYSSYVTLSFNSINYGDSLEVWRSTGAPDDINSYQLLDYVTYSSSSYSDTDVNQSGFYHYRLVLRESGVRTGWGPTKSIYFKKD
ncbi:MAG: hypothetical protein HQK83_16625 [Fibrobacteria bacterium]|nr:hypothetical protein [Fibrobacteria bacterium]